MKCPVKRSRCLRRVIIEKVEEADVVVVRCPSLLDRIGLLQALDGTGEIIEGFIDCCLENPGIPALRSEDEHFFRCPCRPVILFHCNLTVSPLEPGRKVLSI